MQEKTQHCDHALGRKYFIISKYLIVISIFLHFETERKARASGSSFVVSNFKETLPVKIFGTKNV